MAKISLKENQVSFQTSLDVEIVNCIKMLSSHNNLLMKAYLNNFFKDYLLLSAKESGNKYLYGSIKEKLDKVKYV